MQVKQINKHMNIASIASVQCCYIHSVNLCNIYSNSPALNNNTCIDWVCFQPSDQRVSGSAAWESKRDRTLQSDVPRIVINGVCVEQEGQTGGDRRRWRSGRKDREEPKNDGQGEMHGVLRWTMESSSDSSAAYMRFSAPKLLGILVQHQLTLVWYCDWWIETGFTEVMLQNLFFLWHFHLRLCPIKQNGWWGDCNKHMRSQTSVFHLTFTWCSEVFLML